MVRKAIRKPKPTGAHEVTPSTTLQKGTKESPILLLSDDESEGEESTRRPLRVNAVPQKRYLGVSPSDAYTFQGHGSAYDMMIAMGYKPDRGLGPNLRGNVRPSPIELRKLRAGVGYRTTSVSRSPSPVLPPRKAPVKIIRPPKEPEYPVAKAAPRTSSQPRAKTQKSAPPKSKPFNPPPNPPKQSTPTQPLLPPSTVMSPPPPSRMPVAPSDFYISMMSGLAMANIPQTMQVAAAADPMAAFHLAQMCFAPPSTFSLPCFPFMAPQPDSVIVRPQLHTPKLPPKPVSNSATKSNPKLAPVPPPAPSPVLQESTPTYTPISTSISDPSVTIEMDPLVLKQKRQARRHNIGWIPEPGFPDRGTFNLVPTINYSHWSSSDDTTQPDPRRSLVMEDLPLNCRTTKFVRSWSDKFSAIAVYLNGGGKALIEFPSREIAEEAYDSPRLRDGPYRRATHVRAFWYRPQPEAIASSSTSITSGNTGATGEVEDVPADATSANITTPPEELVPMDIDDPIPPAETVEIGKKTKSKGKGTSLPPPERDLPEVNLPVRFSTAPTFTSKPESLDSVLVPPIKVDPEEQRQRPSPVDRATNGSQGGSEHAPSCPPISPPLSASSTSCSKTPSPRPRSPSPETTQQKRTPTGSPPSLRYPSSSPGMTNDKDGVPSPSEETSAHDTPSPTCTSDPEMAGDSSLEQQLRMKLLAMKQTRITSRSSEHSSSISTPSTVVDPDLDTLFKVASPPPVSQSPNGIVMSESLELLATSFITNTLQAAQGLPSEPEKFETAMRARLNKKRGPSDAFGSSADIAFKRQRLVQQIEESKRLMERWKAAKTKEERNRIYTLWEGSNRSVELLSKPAATPFQWPCYAERCIIVDSDDEEEPMVLS